MVKEQLEAIWENRWCGIVLSGCVTILCACLFYRVPAPGVSVAIMGGAAALMAARTKATGTEKATWMIIISCLLVIEVVAIRNERNEQAREQSEFIAQQREAFSNIGRGIESSIRQSGEHFSTTMSNLHTLIDSSNSISQHSKEAVYQITGGDAFSVVDISGEAKGFGVVMEGNYPLYDLHIEMYGYQDKLERHEAIPTLSAHVYSPLFPYDLSPYTELNYFITSSARNGVWWETLQLRKVAGIWNQAIKVEQPVLGPHYTVKRGQPLKTRVRYQWVSPAYPLTNGDVKWCKFMFDKPSSESNPCIPDLGKR